MKKVKWYGQLLMMILRDKTEEDKLMHILKIEEKYSFCILNILVEQFEHLF